jgi:hypothetical protein
MTDVDTNYGLVRKICPIIKKRPPSYEVGASLSQARQTFCAEFGIPVAWPDDGEEADG